MIIFIVVSPNNEKKIDISGSNITIRELKKKMFDKGLVETTEITLFFDGKLLEDDSTLEENDISDKSFLICVGKFGGK